MALSVIGSGFGRTGTKSLKTALEWLGFGPCHHMHEAITDPAAAMVWQEALDSGAADMDRLYAGFSSQVDWPGAQFWREAAAAYPEAKVIHTTRPEDQWWSSFEKTIAKLLAKLDDLPLPPHIAGILTATQGSIQRTAFGGPLNDRDRAIAAFRRREAEVRGALPADRLLVFNVAEGWGPLCAFLDAPVPDEPFPRQNLRADFWEQLGGEPADAAPA